MSKLDAIMIDLWGGKIPMDDGPDDLKLAIKAKQDIKDLIRELIDETFDKDDAKAYELWQKVEKL